MQPSNPEYSQESHEQDQSNFTDKLRELIDDAEFEETIDLFAARTAVIEALQGDNNDPEFIKLIWSEYSIACEEVVNQQAPRGTDRQIYAKLQIAVLVHKALILHEIGDMQEYGECLLDAGNYANSRGFTGITQAIGAELDSL